jgi:peptidyl-prolyl cis-trans isomerase B (cyclophilin B)
MTLNKIAAVLCISTCLFTALAIAEAENPMVVLKTSQGDITLELYPDKAPITVKNFIQYVEDGFYDGTIFHRVINSFMIQGGGFDNKMSKKATRSPIKNEAANGLKNDRGTIAMARTMVPDSATAQFFINTVNNNRSLDFKSPSRSGIGYCVFGRVIEGLEVVDKIEAVKTGIKGGMRDVPKEVVLIESATLKMVDVVEAEALLPEVGAEVIPTPEVVPVPKPAE